MRPTSKALLLATSALVPLGFAPAALANPLGASVAAGTAQVSGEGTANLTVNQATDKAIINWQTFNIGNGETTQFVQPSTNSVTLNRVTGGLGSSEIDGALKANGNIFLINPDGILFGPHSVVDVGGLVATTNDIKNDDFMAGRYVFSQPGKADASVVNAGNITAATGGFAALVAPGVRNSGTISARLGKVGLAAANGFTLDFYGDQLLTLNVGDEIAGTVRDVQTGETLDALVKNEGAIKADGGVVQLTAAAARKVVDSVINTTGIIEANSVGMKNGKIVLSAATADTKPADVPTQKVKVSGTLSAAGKKAGETGGKVQITGEDIALAGATIDASGQAGGGTVLVGGDVSGGHPNANVVSQPKAQAEDTSVPTATNVTVDPTSKIDVSATDKGDGGKAVVWADFATDFAGTIYAKGGPNGGDGGFVEVSGAYVLDYANGTFDLSSPIGSAGTILFDPLYTSSINAGEASVLANQLNAGTTAVVYANHVNVNSDIFKTSGPSAWLKIFGDDGITVRSGVTIGSASGALNILLDADADINSLFYNTVKLPFADPNYPGTASTAEQSDTFYAYLNALDSAFFSYVLGGKVSVPSILTANFTGQDYFSSMAGYVSDPSAVASSKLIADGAHFYTNGGSFTAYNNNYRTTQDTRGILSIATTDLPSYANYFANSGAQVATYAYVTNGATTDLFYRMSSYQRTPANVSFSSGSVAPPPPTTQLAAAGSVDLSPLAEAWDSLIGWVEGFFYPANAAKIAGLKIGDFAKNAASLIADANGVSEYNFDGSYVYPSPRPPANGDSHQLQQCVALVEALAKVGTTNEWTNTGSLNISAYSSDSHPSIPPGTPIATFEPDGNYPTDGTMSTERLDDKKGNQFAHAAIFVTYIDDQGNAVSADSGKATGMRILDQSAGTPATIENKYFITGNAKIDLGRHTVGYNYSTISHKGSPAA